MQRWISFLVAAIYIVLAFIYFYGAIQVSIYLLCFVPLCLIVAASVAGRGEKTFRVISYIVSGLTIFVYSYYAVIVFSVVGVGKESFMVNAMILSALALSLLTIYLIRKNANGI